MPIFSRWPRIAPGAGAAKREPILNLPLVVTLSVAVMVAIHAIRMALPEETDDLILGLFAFAPDRYLPAASEGPAWPGGIAADIWSPFTYALLHNDLLHLVSNCTVFAALGNVLARRTTSAAFLLFCVVMAPLSAIGELIMAVYQSAPVIGVSGVICAMLGALARFIFPEPVADETPDFVPDADMVDDVDGRLIVASRVEPDAGPTSPPNPPPISPVFETLRRPKVIQFILGFAVLNLLLVVAAPVLVGGGAGVAWMVHVAGFIAGFLLFPWFDGRTFMRRAGPD
jgi:membrane associated rhomboid family serine protease